MNRPVSTTEVGDKRKKITKTKRADSAATVKANTYISQKNIFPLLSFLSGHLLSAEPEDPLHFLSDLVFRCLKFRDFYGPPPLFFSELNLRTIFNSLSTADLMAEQDYITAMATLGLTEFNVPDFKKNGKIDFNTFEKFAQESLSKNLMGILRTHKLQASSQRNQKDDCIPS